MYVPTLVEEKTGVGRKGQCAEHFCTLFPGRSTVFQSLAGKVDKHEFNSQRRWHQQEPLLIYPAQDTQQGSQTLIIIEFCLISAMLVLWNSPPVLVILD